MIYGNSAHEIEEVDEGKIFESLLKIARDEGLRVSFVPFQASYGRVKGDRIGLYIGMGLHDINYTFAHELAHHFLHYDKGDAINSNENQEYEEQADRAAKMLLDALVM